MGTRLIPVIVQNERAVVVVETLFSSNEAHAVLSVSQGDGLASDSLPPTRTMSS